MIRLLITAVVGTALFTYLWATKMGLLGSLLVTGLCLFAFKAAFSKSKAK